MTRILTAIFAVALLAVGAFLFMGREQADTTALTPLVGAANAQQDAGEIDTSTIREMALGAEDAPVTIVEYASFTCPHCRRFHEGPFKKLKAEYIDTGKVRFIYHDVYFDRYGLWAAMIARCEPEKFFGIADLIYKGQSEWTRGETPQEIVGNLRKIGRLAGIPDDKLDACLSDQQKAQALVAWYQQNAQRDGIQGTPTFIINGKLVENQPWEDLKAVIEAELQG